MKLPVNFLLYLTTTGLLGLAGWTFYQVQKEGSAEQIKLASQKGIDDARDLLAKGRGQMGDTQRTRYEQARWKAVWMAPDILGKGPPPPPPPEDDVPVQPKQVGPVDPLDEVIDLLSLVSDTSTDGKGGQSHVIVRYRETLRAVEPPEWYLRQRENENATAAGAGRPGDQINVNLRTSRPPPRGGAGPVATQSPVPGSSAGRELLQTVWVAGDGSPRFENTLWPPYDNVRLVRVAEDAQSAFFVRIQPPPDGETSGPPPEEERVYVEEEVYKGTFAMSKDLVETMTQLRREGAARLQEVQQQAVEQPSSQWKDVLETERIDGIYNVGRNDEAMFGSEEEALRHINVDSYVSRTGSGMRGLRVMNVSPEIQSRFGVQVGELILSVNGEPVRTKAEAITVGKRLYNRGVRRFTVRFINTGGQEIERTYQAPDR